VLNSGKSEKKQPVKRLFESPETLSAALLSGCKNFTRIRRIDEKRFEALDWGVTLSALNVPEEADFAGVRAHYIRPAKRAKQTASCATWNASWRTCFPQSSC
jgi:molybdate transport system ATP-binding protein